MNVQDRLVIAAAIEKLIAGGEDTAENAVIIISAFHNMKKRSSVVVTTNGTKEGGSVEGMTEHGNVSIQDKDEKIKTIHGLNEERVGKWIVWRNVTSDISSWWIERKQIWFRHFLSQGHYSERDREYFIEYGNDLSPIAFGYVGEPEHWFSFGPFSMYRETIIVLLGETKMPRIPILVISNKD